MNKDVEARLARSTKQFVADESGSDYVKGVIEYSETHLHKGHQTARIETVMDNAIEGTVWGRCYDCGQDFWIASWEMVPKED